MQRATAYFTLLTLVSVFVDGCTRQGPSHARSGVVHGSTARGEKTRHIVEAKAGQTLEVNITSDENNAVFQVYLPGENGTLPGAGEMDDATKFSGKIPSDGRYLIAVGSTRGNATYKLDYSVK
ncbi:MAG TPA: hypothetical protein VFX97_15230 [Pyrinomonadaceae bacterium]|nr:hypothetical protein [Pyrinomonadaceae bacterium]